MQHLSIISWFLFLELKIEVSLDSEQFLITAGPCNRKKILKKNIFTDCEKSNQNVYEATFV